MYACICISAWQDERRTPCSVRSYAYSLVCLHGKALESARTWSGEYMCRQSMLSSGYLRNSVDKSHTRKTKFIHVCACVCVCMCVRACAVSVFVYISVHVYIIV